MKRMAHVSAWLDGRTPRERIMLIVCGALLIGVLCWLLIYRPVAAWAEQAADSRFAAARDEAVVTAALAEVRAPADPDAAGDITQKVQQTAVGHGLTPNLAMAANGDLGFTLAGAPVGPAFGWLADMERDGLRVTSLSVVENADSTVTVEGAVSGAAR